MSSTNDELDVTFDQTEEQSAPDTSPPTISEVLPLGTNTEHESSKNMFVRRLEIPKTNTIFELAHLEKLEKFLQVGADADSFILATDYVEDLEFMVVEGSFFVFTPPNEDRCNTSSRLSIRKSRNFQPLTLLGKTIPDYPICSFANIQLAVFKTAHHIKCYLNLHLIDPVITQSGPKVKPIDVMTLMAAHNIARTQFKNLHVYSLWLNDGLKKKHAEHLLKTLSRSPPMEPTSKKRKRDKDSLPSPKPQPLTLQYLSGLLYLLGLEEVIRSLSEGTLEATEVHHRNPGHHDGTTDLIKDRAAYIRAKSYYVVQSAGFKEHWPKGDLAVLPNSGGIRVWNRVLAHQVRVVYERFMSDMCNSAYRVSSDSTFFALDIANEFYPRGNYALLINGEAADQTTRESTIIKRSAVESQLYPPDFNESSLTSTSTTTEDIPIAAVLGSGMAEVPHPPNPSSSSPAGDQGTPAVDQQVQNQTDSSQVFGDPSMLADTIAYPVVHPPHPPLSSSRVADQGSLPFFNFDPSMPAHSILFPPDLDAGPGLDHVEDRLFPHDQVGTNFQFAVSESPNGMVESSTGSIPDSNWFGLGMAEVTHPPNPPSFSPAVDQGTLEVDQQEQNQTDTSRVLGDPGMPADPIAHPPRLDAVTYGLEQDENSLTPDIQVGTDSQLAVSEYQNEAPDYFTPSSPGSEDPSNADYSPSVERTVSHLVVSETQNQAVNSITPSSVGSDAEPDDPRDADYSPSVESDHSADILVIDETDSQQAGHAVSEADLSEAESDTHFHDLGDGYLAEHVLEAREHLNNDDIDFADDAEQDHQGGNEHGVSEDVDPLTVANILPLIVKTRTRYPKLGTNGIACGNSQMKRGIKLKAYTCEEDDFGVHPPVYFEKPNSLAFEKCSPLANFYMPTLRSQQQCTTKKDLLKCLKETSVRLKNFFSEFHQSLSGTPNYTCLKELIKQFEFLKKSYVEDMDEIAMLFSRIEYTYLFDPKQLQAPVPPFSDVCSPIHALRIGCMQSYQRQLSWFADFNMAPLRKFASFSDLPEHYLTLSAPAKTGLLAVTETAVNLIAAGGGSKGSILGVCLNHSINRGDSFYRDHLWTTHPDFLTELTPLEREATSLEFGVDPTLLSFQNRISWTANQESVTEPASAILVPASDNTPHASYYELNRLCHKIRNKVLYFSSSQHIYSRLLVDSLTVSGAPPLPAVSIFDRIDFPHLSKGSPSVIGSLFTYIALQVVMVYRDEMAAIVTSSLVKKVPSTSPNSDRLYHSLRGCHTKSSIDEFMDVLRDLTDLTEWPFEGPDQSQPIKFDHPEVTAPGKELSFDFCTTQRTLILIVPPP
jgi:hypothetical protein